VRYTCLGQESAERSLEVVLQLLVEDVMAKEVGNDGKESDDEESGEEGEEHDEEEEYEDEGDYEDHDEMDMD
jgi:hypothetical protein